jgi:hypothetical protein
MPAQTFLQITMTKNQVESHFLFVSPSGHTRGNAKENLQEGVWLGEVPSPFNLEAGPITRPPGTPKDPGPRTQLYHDNKLYMRDSPRLRCSNDLLPSPVELPRIAGYGWKFIEKNNTPFYGDIAWKIGDVYSELDIFMFENSEFDSIESYWQASLSLHLIQRTSLLIG